jgi:hypothetical protein
MGEVMKRGNWNPARVLEALGRIGYNPTSAILDIVDNSISAKCETISININAIKVESYNGGKRTVIDSIIISDDGIGMDEEGIDNALSLGSSTDYYDAGTLSKFGLGLKSAASSLGKCLEIITKTHSGDWLYAKLDQQYIVDEYNYEFKVVDKKMINKIVPIDIELRNSGTIIILSNIRTESMPSVAKIITKLTQKAGVVYNHYISGEIADRNKINISVNGETVKPFDPLFIHEIDDKDGKLDENLWDGVSVKWIARSQIIQLHPEGALTAEVCITQLPHPPTVGNENILPANLCREKYMIGAGNYGFYIYRNGRLISWADPLEMIGFGQDLYSFRGRLLLNSDADEILSIDVTKSRILLSEIAKDQLIPLVSEAKKKSKSAWSHASAELNKKINSDPHNSISGELDEVSKLLDHDDKIDENISSPEEKSILEKRRKSATNKKKTTEEESNILKSQGQRVQYVSSLDNNQLWERAHDADVGIIVKVNQSHRLYKELIETQQDNSYLIKTMDILFFALARGEYSLIYKSNYDTKLIEKIVDEYRERVGGDLSEIIKNLSIRNIFED